MVGAPGATAYGSLDLGASSVAGRNAHKMTAAAAPTESESTVADAPGISMATRAVAARTVSSRKPCASDPSKTTRDA